MLHTFVAYVEDLPGVLTRVASLFRRLNININSLTVGPSERPHLSRLTWVIGHVVGRQPELAEPDVEKKISEKSGNPTANG